MSDAIIKIENFSIEDRTLPENWEYETSVSEFRERAMTWRNVSADLLRRVWVANQMLSRPGARTDLGKGHTFEGWCQDAGLAKATAYRWLKGYDPLTHEKIPTSSQKAIEEPIEESHPTSSQMERGGDAEPEDSTSSHLERGQAIGAARDSSSESSRESENQDYRDSVDYGDHLEAVLSDMFPPGEMSRKEAERCVKLLDKIRSRCLTVSRELKNRYGQVDRGPEEIDLYNRLKAAYESHTSMPIDWRVQGPACWRLVDTAVKHTEDPPSFIKAFLDTYWRLITKSQERFWQDQPWLMSRAMSNGIFPMIVKQMENGHSGGLDDEQRDALQEVFASRG